MSYSSRVYRQRNPNTHDESRQKSFFAGKDKQEKGSSAEKVQDESFEREADSVANTVVNNAHAPAIQQQKISSVQRLATSKEDEKTSTTEERMKEDKDVQEKPLQLMESPEKKDEEPVQKMNDPAKEDEKIQKADEPKMEDEKMKDKGIQKKDENEPEEEEKESTTPVQPKLNGESVGTPQARTDYLHRSKGKGSPLSKDLLYEMNSRFGYDFSGVRIHNDSEAHRVSKELHAQAFTHGQDIYFNEGKFDPTSAEGKLLLAHELTHVIQQTGGEQ